MLNKLNHGFKSDCQDLLKQRIRMNQQECQITLPCNFADVSSKPKECGPCIICTITK